MNTLLIFVLITSTLSASIPSWGFNPEGTRYTKSKIDSSNIARAVVESKVSLCGPIVSSPSIIEQDEFLPSLTGFSGDFGSCLTAFKEDGSILWQKNMVTDYGLMIKAFSRNTPYYYKGMLVIVQSGRWGYLESSFGVWTLVVNATTGNLMRKVLTSDFNRAYLTGSVNVNDKGVIFVGLSSGEEAASAVAALSGQYYNCCYFGGKLIAYNITNLAVIWERPTIPTALVGPGQYSGAAIVGHPTLYKNRVYVTTANLYWVPQSVTDCLLQNGFNASCVDPNVHFNAVLAINQDTGVIEASFRSMSYDAWVVSCLVANLRLLCPPVLGDDYAFIESAVVVKDSKGEASIGVGQKSGIYWYLNAEDLRIKWKTTVGPGSFAGGVMYASTINEEGQIFVASTNGRRNNWTTIDGQVINSGAWLRLSPATGVKIWEKPTSDNSIANAALASTNDIVLGQTGAGTMVAMRASTGETLWNFTHSIIASIAGPTIHKERIYWGTGRVLQFVPGSFPTPHYLYIFKVPA